MRLCLHGHEQGGGPPSPTPEDRLDPRRRVREIHAVAELSRRYVPALQQANALPLPQVLLRCSRPGPNVCAQVPPSRVSILVSERDHLEGHSRNRVIFLSIRNSGEELSYGDRKRLPHSRTSSYSIFVYRESDLVVYTQVP
ncbi:Uncharacterized protein APZ42_026593 [Daphnia magna]|uniref:Uncharacterized protein n=1 Tax=Daphnia magna TaxID=35525 RepID=A0A164S4G4_9CRUS|nr:Uncharacterized protein APZ42_026593 [Daphnia magna]